MYRFCQVLKGAVGSTVGQNEAEVKFHLEIDHHISSTVQSVWSSLLVLWVRCGSQCPFEMLHLPHSGRGSQQLLLSMTHYCVRHFIRSTFLPKCTTKKEDFYDSERRICQLYFYPPMPLKYLIYFILKYPANIFTHTLTCKATNAKIIADFMITHKKIVLRPSNSEAKWPWVTGVILGNATQCKENSWMINYGNAVYINIILAKATIQNFIGIIFQNLLG